jgi:hypothetical protein
LIDRIRGQFPIPLEHRLLAWGKHGADFLRLRHRFGAVQCDNGTDCKKSCEPHLTLLEAILSAVHHTSLKIMTRSAPQCAELRRYRLRNGSEKRYSREMRCTHHGDLLVQVTDPPFGKPPRLYHPSKMMVIPIAWLFLSRSPTLVIRQQKSMPMFLV